MHTNAPSAQLEHQIGESLRNGRMFLEYQPIVSLQNGEVIGAEALLRGHHSAEVRLPAASLAPAPESAAMLSVGDWVLDGAVHQLAQWQARTGKEISIFVNVSPQQICRPDFQSAVCDVLKKHEVPAERLTLEITEHSPLSRDPLTGTKVQSLQKFGVRIALDDLGEGYNTAQALQAVRADVVKIDQALVANIERDEWGAKIVGGIVVIVHRLGLQVVVEGVETEKHHEVVERLSADYAQGYYYGRPTRAERFEELYLHS